MAKVKKKLFRFIEILPQKKVFGSEDIFITGVSDDSRKVQKGNLFVAISGFTLDAHKFIPEAIRKGASVVVGEKEPQKSWLKAITYIKVSNSREALSYLASFWYGQPAKKLKVIGVTGTDGKTTTANMIKAILEGSGRKVGLISTIGAEISKKVYETGAHVTNPEPLELQKILNLMVMARCTYCVMEVTSQGIDQQRIAGVDFDTAVLTNITPEHLFYHKTFETYRDTKLKLFQKAKNAVLNKDDSSFPIFTKRISPITNIYTYSLKQKADFWADKIQENAKVSFQLNYKNKKIDINLNFPGQFNVANALAAIAASRIYKIPFRIIKKALQDFRLPEGRLEEIKNQKGIKIFIDFAHTPNALQNVLTTLRPKTNAKLIVVFGCASERDDSKRPVMGEIAGRIADFTVLTSEDPRNESIARIIEEIAAGAKRGGAMEVDEGKFNSSNHQTRGNYFLKIPDRGEAIYFAINKIAQKGDLVVICGKGHEKSMNIKGIEYPWSDRKAVTMALGGKVKKIS